MTIRNILISVVMMFFVTFGVIKGFMYYNAKQKIDKLIYPMKSYLNVRYEGISTSLLGSIGVKGLRFTAFDGEEIVTFGKVTLSSFDKDENEIIPSNISITLQDVRFDTRFLPEVTNEKIPSFVKELGYGDLYKVSNNLYKLGYDKIIADINFEFSYTKEVGGVNLRFQEKIKQLGEFDILLEIIGFIPGMRSMGTELKINKMRLVFNDDSYTNRLLSRLAAKENRPVDEYRTELVNKLQHYLEINKIILTHDDINALKKFIKKPDKLTISLNPSDPEVIENLKFYKREDVLKLLNLNISSE